MSGIHGIDPNAARSDTTMRDLLAVIFRRKWLILGIFGVTSILVGIKQFSTPPTYSADSTLLLNRQGARSSVFDRGGRALPWTEVVESEIEVVTSLPVLQRAQQILAEPSEAFPEGLELNVNRIGRMVKSGVVGESNVLYVTGTAGNPEQAVAVTNAVAEAYVAYHEELYELPDAGPMITARADSTLSLLQAAEARRASLLAEVGVTDLNGHERVLVSQREALHGKLRENERKLARVETELEDARAFLESGFEALPFTENTGSFQGQALSNVYQKLLAKRAELAQLEQKYTADHPLVREARATIANLEIDLRSQTDVIIGTRQHESRALRRENAQLRGQIDEISRTLARLPEIVHEVSILDAQIAALGSQYRKLSDESVTSEINRSSYADYSVKILSPALSASQNQRGDIVRVMLAPILALMAGIGLAFYLENLDHSVTNREDIERHVSIPVLASFPESRLDDDEGGGSGSVRSVPFRRRSKNG